MDSAAARHAPTEARVFRDGLGDRVLLRDAQAGDTVEMLRLRPELTGVPSFEFALNEQCRRLETFEHPGFSRVRRLDRLSGRTPTFGLVSDHVPGLRLSEILATAEQRRLRLDINAALGLVRQIVASVAGLHRQVREASHGALGPERIVIAAGARPTIVEYVLGPALEQLRLSHDRYWNEFRIAVPPSAGPARFDARADIAQIGMIALALILGRALGEDERLRCIGETLAGATQASSRGDGERLAPGVRSWLARALQVDLRRSFASAIVAEEALEEVVADGGFTASPGDAQAFMKRYQGDTRQTGPTAVPVPDTPRISAGPQWAHHVETVTPGPWVAVTPAREAIAPPVDRSRNRVAFLTALLLAAAGGGLEVARTYSGPAPLFGGSRPLVVDVQPEGIEVIVDGQSRGIGPVTLTLEPGSHTIRLRAGAGPRAVPPTASVEPKAPQKRVRAGVNAPPVSDTLPATAPQADEGTPPTAASPGSEPNVGELPAPWVGTLEDPLIATPSGSAPAEF
jgi:hypothetical protein